MINNELKTERYTWV